ncbi:MAG: dihydroneopterin aldolase [Prevotellaceae bacterium]|jgi:dihydroneopterin aldolase|nr:dihydroneopterin aldolase [Prevotellaceae bacterium]
MGIVELENMEFFARHGCFTEERIIGNQFIVNLRMEVDIEKPMKSDNLEGALNYQQAYLVVKGEMEQPSRLLEHVAGRIVDALYKEFEQIKKITVKVSKMNPPVGGKVGSSSVTFTK